MDYREARVYLDDAAKYGSVLGLDNMRELLSRLGNPQNRLKFIHISGTNGKGSTLAYISTILKEAGYRVGRYISPTLFSYRERIQVNGEYIKRDSLARITTEIAEVIEGMVSDGKVHPTIFEIETVMSFLYFIEENCDLVVLETGMGGLEDATNVITTTVIEVIASISMDHMQFLGDTLGKIAAQKAGIIKKDTTVVTTKQKDEAYESIRKKADEMNAEVVIADPQEASDICYGLETQTFSYEGMKDLQIHLSGVYQVTNAVLAVKAILELRKKGYSISEEQIRKGLEATTWRGRFTVIGKEPLFVIDGAHNQDAARVLESSIKEYFTGRRIFVICGVFRDKEYIDVLKAAANHSDHFIAIQTPGNPRALPAKELAENAKAYFKVTEVPENIEEAVRRAYELADQKDDVILAFGSLSHLSEIVRAAEKVQEERTSGSGKN